MGVILGKSKALTPKGVKEIRAASNIEKKITQMTVDIAKSFGQQSKKIKPKKIILR